MAPRVLYCGSFSSRLAVGYIRASFLDDSHPAILQLFLSSIFGVEKYTTMSYKLVCASGANPAGLLPATLIATSVNEARPSPVVEITYENAPTLPSGDVIEFTGANGKTVQGLDAVIAELRVQFPFLNSKYEAQVCRC